MEESATTKGNVMISRAKAERVVIIVGLLIVLTILCFWSLGCYG